MAALLNYTMNEPQNLNSTYQSVKPPDGVYSSSGSIGDPSLSDFNDTLVSGGSSSGSIPYWDKPTTIILSMVICVLIFLSIIGNLLVISVVVRHRGMRTRTNMFLVNLAVADFLVGSVLMPFSLVTLIHGRWIFSEAICTLNGFLNALCLMTSNQLLMYISVHKYFSITRPFSRFLTIRKIWVMIAAAWLWATLCSVLTVTGLQRVIYKNGTMQCGPDYPRDILAYMHHGIIQVTDIFIPLGVMTFCYTRIFMEMRQHTKRMRQNSTLEKDTILATQKKVTITLFIVLACFVSCWMPYHLYASYVSYKRGRTFPPIINAVAYMFGYLNSACNPIIYALRSPSFRDGYLEILCRKSTVVVSDDSLEPGSPSLLWRRMSSLFGSMRGSVRSSGLRSGSENDHVEGNRRLSSSNSSCKLISPKRRKLSSQGSSQKLIDGSSIVKRNGSIVVMKAGKIVCVRNPKQQYQGNAASRTPVANLAMAGLNVISEIEGRPLLGNGNAFALKSDSVFQEDSHSSDNNDLAKNNTRYIPETDKMFHSSETISPCGHNPDNRQSISLTEILESSEMSDISKSLSDLDREGAAADGRLSGRLSNPKILVSRSTDNLDRKGAADGRLSNLKIAVSRSTDHFDFSFFKPSSQNRPMRLCKSDNCLDKSDSYEATNKAQHKQKAFLSKTKPKVGPLLRPPSVEHLDKRPKIRPKYRRSISDTQETKTKSKLPASIFPRRSWLGFKHKASVLKTKMSHSKDEITIL